RVLIASFTAMAGRLANGGVHDLENDFAARQRGRNAIEDTIEVGADLHGGEIVADDGVVDGELDEDGVGLVGDDVGVDVSSAPFGALSALCAIRDRDEAGETRGERVFELRHPRAALGETRAEDDDVLWAAGFERGDETGLRLRRDG